MTISGSLTKREILLRMVRAASIWFTFGGVGFAFFFFVVRLASTRFSPDRFTQLAALACFPSMGAMGLAATLWSDRWIVVEFVSDNESLRLRKFGRTAHEIHSLSEIADVQGIHWKNTQRVHGYLVTFRDGSQAVFGNRLPNLQALIRRLSAHPRASVGDCNGAGALFRFLFSP